MSSDRIKQTDASSTHHDKPKETKTDRQTDTQTDREADGLGQNRPGIKAHDHVLLA